MTALERLAQAAGRTQTGSATGTAAETYDAGTGGPSAASEVNLDFLVTVTVSVTRVN